MLKKSDLEILAKQCTAEIRKAMKDSGTDASGKTSREIFEVVSDYEIEIFANRGGFANVEAGQSKGKRPYNFRDIIKQWILDKGISIAAMPYSPNYKGIDGKIKFSNAKDRGLYYAAGAIAYSNAKKGSSLWRSGGRRDVFTPAVEKLVDAVTEAYAMELTTRIEAIFINSELA